MSKTTFLDGKDRANAFVTAHPGLTLAVILAVAAALRFYVIVFFPNTLHPDENFQLFEQAHRLAFGYGIMPWEFEDGIRSMVLPVLLAGIFRIAEPLVGGPEGYLIAARALLALATLPGIAAVYFAGKRVSPRHALLGGLAMALWFELIYFAGKPLTEAVASTFLICGVALASPERAQWPAGRLAAIGALLATAVLLRLQVAPGAFFVAAMTCRHRFSAGWLPFCLGAIGPLVFFGAADWIAWGSPFHSYLAGFTVNLLNGKASSFGTSPLDDYLLMLPGNWGVAGTLLIACFLPWSLRRYRLFVATAFVIIAVHSLIPHKEYRFVIPAITCLVAGIGLGAADLVDRLVRGRVRLPPSLLTAVFAAAIAVVSAGQAILGPFRIAFITNGGSRAMMTIAHRPDICGIFLDYNVTWGRSGGYAHLHRDIPIYDVYVSRWTTEEMRANAPAFNAVITRADISQILAGYHQDRCFYDGWPEVLCLYSRPGTCERQPGATPLLEHRRLGEN